MTKPESEFFPSFGSVPLGKTEPRTCNACGKKKTEFMLDFSHPESDFKWSICTDCFQKILTTIAEAAGCRPVNMEVCRGKDSK